LTGLPLFHYKGRPQSVIFRHFLMRQGFISDIVVPPTLCGVDLSDGSMSGSTGTKRSLIRDLAGLFADEMAFMRIVGERGEDVAYSVHEFRPERGVPQELVFGTSTVLPGRIGSEFFMTRGHIHSRTDRPEVYFGQRGRGVLHMETPAGETRPVEMAPGVVVYVPPYWVHRSVNVGEEPLIMFFCYPADAGQDYAIIERARGMRTLIVADGAGGWAEAENSRYRPRSPEEVRRYMAGGQ
jgi:glucose-6-phosphate isomerase